MILTKEDPSTWRQIRPSSKFFTLNGLGSNTGLLGDRSHSCIECGLHVIATCFKSKLDHCLYWLTCQLLSSLLRQ
jgi:hypothetical protein